MKFIEDLIKKKRLNKNYKKLLYSLLKLCELRFDFACAKCKKLKIGFYEALVKFYGFEKDKPDLKSWDNLKKRLQKISLNEAVENKKRIVASLFKNSQITYDCIKKRKSCLSWKIQDKKGEMMGIHFKNAIMPKSPLKGKRFENRKKEMKNMLKEIKTKYPKIKFVFGSSWMYNLKPYNKLHSRDFVRKLKPAYSHKNKTIAYWGQFLYSNGSFNERGAKEFRKRWKFPYMRLTATTTINYFFKKYKIN
jgi:hypothetical protein